MPNLQYTKMYVFCTTAGHPERVIEMLDDALVYEEWVHEQGADGYAVEILCLQGNHRSHRVGSKKEVSRG